MNKDIQRALIDGCGRYIRKKLEPLEQRIQELENQVAQLQEKSAVAAMTKRQPTNMASDA